MKTNKGVLSHRDVEWMDALGKAMKHALSSDNGLIALAQEMVPEITRELEEKFWVPLVLREDPLPVGKVPKYRVKEEVEVHWMAPGGEPAQQRVRKGQEIQFPMEMIEAFIVVKARDLKLGYVSDLTSQQAEAGRKIRNQINASAAAVLSAAADSANSGGAQNIFNVTSGGKLTLDAVKGAIAYYEDQEMSIKQMIMRGSRLVDMYDWSLPEEVRAELIKAGVLKKLGTAGLIGTSSANSTEVICTPDDEVGVYAIGGALTVEPWRDVPKDEVGFVARMEVSLGVLHPARVFKITIA